jgi:hypothetical protein
MRLTEAVCSLNVKTIASERERNPSDTHILRRRRRPRGAGVVDQVSEEMPDTFQYAGASNDEQNGRFP